MQLGRAPGSAGSTMIALLAAALVAAALARREAGQGFGRPGRWAGLGFVAISAVAAHAVYRLGVQHIHPTVQLDPDAWPGWSGPWVLSVVATIGGGLAQIASLAGCPPRWDAPWFFLFRLLALAASAGVLHVVLVNVPMV